MDVCDIEILDTTKTISDFINDKIKELNSASFIQDSEVSFHVANLDDLHQKHIRWLRTLPRVKPFYAVKCNSTPAVIRMLSTLGTGFDCASKFSKVINEALDEFFPADSGVQVIAEPGRYYVDSAFTLAVNVFAKKVVMDDVTQIRGVYNVGKTGESYLRRNDIYLIKFLKTMVNKI
uniref:ornithine decarboxylase n=1 Tax=Sphaeramia orbicularis TaxID=375764 RepID=A0A672Y785_9TELE